MKNGEIPHLYHTWKRKCPTIVLQSFVETRKNSAKAKYPSPLLKLKQLYVRDEPQNSHVMSELPAANSPSCYPKIGWLEGTTGDGSQISIKAVSCSAYLLLMGNMHLKF